MEVARFIKGRAPCHFLAFSATCLPTFASPPTSSYVPSPVCLSHTNSPFTFTCFPSPLPHSPRPAIKELQRDGRL